MSIDKNPKQKYIIAVDDAPDNLVLIQLVLEEEGHKVVLTHNGPTALKMIEKSPPDLVVLDVMMPEMSGYEVTQRIRNNSNLPFIPILLITAHEASSVVKGLDLGADEFIRKPVQVDELQARVRSLLRLKQTIDQRENFVSCLTHDLRTPLVAADRMLTLFHQGIFGETTPQMERAISKMRRNNENLLEMLNNLLEVHCYEVGEKIFSFTPFNLQELLAEVVTELTPLAEEKGLDMQLHVGELSQLVSQFTGDRLELRRVLTNSIGNAIKFTDIGRVYVSLGISANGVVIEIQDTGIGMSPEDQETIFERFRQGNHKRSGNGLGLHLCRQVVQAHQGTIAVKSELDKGTVFTIELPGKMTSIPQ